jgi:hypothetical protein
VEQRSPVQKVAGLLVEAGMIVFAVMVALGVEEWRNERGLEDFADRVQESVVAELEANLEELRSTAPSLRATQATLGQVVATGDLSLLSNDVSFELPEISSAAWSAAQSSEAGPYLDYEWVIQVARAYESYELYTVVTHDLLSALTRIIAPGPEVEAIEAIFGHVAILNDIHGQVAERFEAIVVTEEADAEGPAASPEGS